MIMIPVFIFGIISMAVGHFAISKCDPSVVKFWHYTLMSIITIIFLFGMNYILS